MNQTPKRWRDVLIAVVIALIGYVILLNSSRPALVDMVIETFLFASAGLIGLFAYQRSSKNGNKYFRRFTINYGLTYAIVAVSSLLAVFYLLQNPLVHEIGIANVKDSNLLIFMSSLKSVSFVFLLIGWFSFYQYLGIKSSKVKQIGIFLVGFLVYFGCSLLIMKITNDLNVLSLGVVVGLAIGIFAMIAQDASTKYLSLIFVLFSFVHLWEFYLMGLGENLTIGINNPIYWAIWVMYIFEVRRWLQKELA